mgnify:CR=1 FL=1
MQKTFNVSRYSFVDQLFKVASPDGRTGRVRAAALEFGDLLEQVADALKAERGAAVVLQDPAEPIGKQA